MSSQICGHKGKKKKKRFDEAFSLPPALPSDKKTTTSWLSQQDSKLKLLETAKVAERFHITVMKSTLLSIVFPPPQLI